MNQQYACLAEIDTKDLCIAHPVIFRQRGITSQMGAGFAY